MLVINGVDSTFLKAFSPAGVDSACRFFIVLFKFSSYVYVLLTFFE